MKNNLLIAMIIVFGWAGLGPASTWAEESEELTVPQILEKADEITKTKSSKGTMETIIVTTGGSKRTLVSEAWSKDGTDKQLTRYIKPARVKGESMLMLNDGDDIWYYSPRTDRVRKIASHAKKKKVMGSDFSYEDMASGSMSTKYTGKLLGLAKEAKKKCYHLELIPTEDGPSYTKIQAWVDKENFVMMRVDYWDDKKGDKPFKRLVLSDVKEISGYLTPMHYVMKNLKEGSETVMNMLEIEYDLELKDSLFTERNLKKR
jgi:outer membrane lipoprotein-sorting protein